MIVPAEERLHLGRHLLDHVPLRHVLRAGIVERRHLDVAPHRLRFRDIGVGRAHQVQPHESANRKYHLSCNCRHADSIHESAVSE